MKVLLDENLPRKLAGHLVGHECRTVVACGWSGKKNGDLLALADPQFGVLFDARQKPALTAESGHKTNRASAAASCADWCVVFALANASVDSNQYSP